MVLRQPLCVHKIVMRPSIVPQENRPSAVMAFLAWQVHALEEASFGPIQRVDLDWPLYYVGQKMQADLIAPSVPAFQAIQICIDIPFTCQQFVDIQASLPQMDAQPGS